jgi:hypothetical protein
VTFEPLNQTQGLSAMRYNIETLLFDPDDLEGIHQYLLANEVVDLSDEMRMIVEENWPELLTKVIPPRHKMH